MRRIFADFAYGPGPRDGCWWDETAAAPNWPDLQEPVNADVAIIGGGFTGMSAALHLAEAGVDVVLLEAETPGWGASGRNGGFCCLGGGKASSASIDRTYGAGSAQAFHDMQLAAVELVSHLLDRLDIDADTHSHGETQLAHRSSDMNTLRREADEIARQTGRRPVLIEQDELAAQGMNGPFFGALTDPVGFGLNPRKYLFGLAAAARRAGARCFQRSPAISIRRSGSGHVVATPQGQVSCDQVIVATNGYSSEDLPDWMAARYMPAQSTVLVTRPLSDNELAAQGWTTDQIAFDTRSLLHYFRLMPDRRFLFGMRGGLRSSPRAEQRARARTRHDFEQMFPAWSAVPSPNCWSGFVCLSQRWLPFVGAVPGHPGLFAGFAYHGNGVAMGTYSGWVLSQLVQGRTPDGPFPDFIAQSPGRFVLGGWRRALMVLAYSAFRLKDM